MARQAILASRDNAFLSVVMLFFMGAAGHYGMFCQWIERLAISVGAPNAVAFERQPFPRVLPSLALLGVLRPGKA
jgi:hypothetical protein